MDKRDHIDLTGAVMLTGFSILLAFNQVVIKVTNGGLQPVFFAGLRSLGAVLCIWLWLKWRGIPLNWGGPAVRGAGIAIGCVFAFEFLLLFIALDLTTVARTSVLFYAMPVWMALGAHLFVPGDRMTASRLAGLSLSVCGVAIAMLGRSEGVGSLWGDLAAVGAAMGWAAAGLMVKATSLRTIRPEMQLMWQVAVSAPILLLLAPLFGDLVRDLQPIHLAGLAFQIVVVVSAGFILWFWLMSIYPASGVASFSFLAPVFGVFLGWWLLDEPVTPALIGALVLVASGIVLINRPPKRLPPG
ncbi:DMT family transporter [Ponticoccus sp. SC2-23]|uniref:DMT family transporter n=1 Tax=Alexandriicola marinus TaxID=2081710 RepID=UPI000FDA32C5|nr:DMT family transporter [Alexandriicola marinus]MBM1222547.1 DMT family transporter [Ponticoccus sp. SC6-9]MBM1227052.1 DMT family transporter [Ponticoccus sp. SC6-15]MBM1231473.1 DMT family transporter [Ponticoccus sp. SC6-38]MBM1236091.1 DMT family transporter [Ponticoccus sp. SC6-45]MBM1240496.1 DMT family transporter [Ponticoccus sp. SC6-49]MBM1245031.1 DMT family transporter [Ponticoccus sp. SC2-64]MBM1249565.1 DMT family transporter [Ponticoccus sp. SC6-42]MBM1253989.1 DMT family tr